MNWEEFQIEKNFYRKAWEYLKVDYGIVSIALFSKADPNGAKIVDDLIKKDILGKVSSKEVYLKFNEANSMGRPQEIANGNFNEIWSILQRFNSTQEELCKYLGKSYLTVTYKWYFGIDDDLITASKECPEFFVSKGSTFEFLDTVRKIKVLEDLKAHKKEDLEDLMDDLEDFDKKDIFVVDDWRIGPVFPTIDMQHIQTIKKSPYCDQEKTIMRGYSIAVVLKKIL